MAYSDKDKKEMLEKAKQEIEKNNLFFIEDVVAFIPISKDTFYRFWPVDSDEYDSLKALLEDNKIKTKSSIRAKLYKGTKASELLALYKLICTPEERAALSMTHIDHTTKGKEMKQQDLSPEIIEKLLDKL